MPDMIVRKRRHGEITVIVPVLPSHVHFALALGRFEEVLREQLALFVEVVVCALIFFVCVSERVTSIEKRFSFLSCKRGPFLSPG